MELTESDPSNPRRCPRAQFIENVEKWLKENITRTQPDAPQSTRELVQQCDATSAQLDELYNKYKFMEENLVAKRTQLGTLLPELRTNLELIDTLLTHRDAKTLPVETTFLLADQVLPLFAFSHHVLHLLHPSIANIMQLSFMLRQCPPSKYPQCQIFYFTWFLNYTLTIR